MWFLAPSWTCSPFTLECLLPLFLLGTSLSYLQDPSVSPDSSWSPPYTTLLLVLSPLPCGCLQDSVSHWMLTSYGKRLFPLLHGLLGPTPLLAHSGAWWAIGWQGMEKAYCVRVSTTLGVSAIKSCTQLDTIKQCSLNFSNVLMNHLGSYLNAGFDLERGPRVCISNELPHFTLWVTKWQKITQVPNGEISGDISPRWFLEINDRDESWQWCPWPEYRPWLRKSLIIFRVLQLKNNSRKGYLLGKECSK